MTTIRTLPWALSLVAVVALGLGDMDLVRAQDALAGAAVSVYATGLANPRGLTLGVDGALYVAEAGSASKETVNVGSKRKEKVGYTGRVTRITSANVQAAYTSNLPSAYTWHDDDVGPASLAVLNGQMYLVTAAGGTDIGDPGFNNRIVELLPNGSTRSVLDLNEYNARFPSQARVNDPVKADVPGGMPWGLAAMSGNLYMTDANHEFVLEVSPDGPARRILEYPASHRVLTGISAGPDGWLYIAEFGPLPYFEGTGGVLRLKPSGELEQVAMGLTTPVAAVMTASGTLYVLEFSAPLRQVPNSGRLLSIAPNGDRTILLEHLHFPTALTQGPDGAFYISNSGHLTYKGDGQILRVTVPPPTTSQPVSLPVGLIGGVAIMVLASVVAVTRIMRVRVGQH